MTGRDRTRPQREKSAAEPRAARAARERSSPESFGWSAEPSSERRGAASMQDAVRGFLRDSGLAAQMRHWPVFEAWSQALGSELARRARPVRFTRGELCVEVESAAHLHELSNFSGERYREIANAKLGKPEIQRIVFRLKR
jgi:hypothetical protein